MEVSLNSIKENFFRYLYITFATIVYGMAISLFLDKNDLVPGGISGLAIILNRLINIETGTVIFIVNVPVLIIGAWKFGIRFIVDTLYVVVVSSIVINIFSNFTPITEDRFLAAVIGGAMLGYGLGTILKNGASSGGMDIIVQFIGLKYKHMKTATIFLVSDIVVIVLSYFVFKNIEITLYSIITGVTCSIVMDKVLYGKDEAKLLYIIMKDEYKEKELVECLLKELEVGVTYLKGMGAYKNSEKKIVMCAIRKNQLPRAKDIVRDIDDSAFMIITSANEILGRGYKSHYSKSL
jgi:uncharacterized membrane-anchored protein YitT (DUF2179 family)